MPNPAFSPLPLQGFDLSQPDAAKLFQQYLATTLQQIQNALTPNGLASILSGNLNLTSALSMVQVSSTPTTNQTVDTKQSSLVLLRYIWSTAANFSVTLNNVVDGQILQLRIAQSSGAARTITINANTVTPTAMAVGTANNTLSSGVSINSGVTTEYIAMASATNLLYIGVGQNW